MLDTPQIYLKREWQGRADPQTLDELLALVPERLSLLHPFKAKVVLAGLC